MQNMVKNKVIFLISTLDFTYYTKFKGKVKINPINEISFENKFSDTVAEHMWR